MRLSLRPVNNPSPKRQHKIGETKRDNILKVNLGCGITVVPGWTNIDISPNIWLSRHPFLKRILYEVRLLDDASYRTKWPSEIVRHDIRKGLPFQDDSVDYIYTSHFLGHVNQHEAVRIIGDCYRVLKPQGYLRIVVSDLRLYATKYTRDEITAEDFLHSLGIGCSSPRNMTSNFLCRHLETRWLYDFRSLACLLNKCGFRRVTRRRFREGRVPDIEALDNREEISLFVEAQK